MCEPATVDASGTREEFVRALVEFIQGPLFARHGVSPANIDAFTPLFESGAIDSLGIIDLLAFVEQATGTPVPLRKVDMRFFGTIDRIAHTFWRGAERS
jgi:acyl carrier protein